MQKHRFIFLIITIVLSANFQIIFSQPEPYPNPLKVKLDNANFRKQLQKDKIKSLTLYTGNNNSGSDTLNYTSIGHYDKNGLLIDSSEGTSKKLLYNKGEIVEIWESFNQSTKEEFTTKIKYKYTAGFLSQSLEYMNDTLQPDILQYSYYPNGLLESIIGTDTSTNVIKKKYYCFYDTLGNYIEEIDSINAGEGLKIPVIHRNYKYDKKHRLISFIDHAPFFGEWERKYTYDKSGLLEQETLRMLGSEEKFPTSKVIYKYNSQKLVSEAIYYDSQNLVERKIQFEYDNAGKLIVQKTYKDYSKSSKTENYFYNSKGYLIKYVEKDSDTPSGTYVNKYEYEYFD